MKRLIRGLICVAVVGSAIAAEVTFPVRLNIDVSAKRSRRQVGAGDEGEVKRETVQVKVKVNRTGGDIPEGKMSAELYVIGKQVQSGNYGIIDVQKGEFELTEENKYSGEYTSPVYTLAETKGNINVGGRYETYLVVICDPDGNIIDYRSGRALSDEAVAFIRKLGPKTMFDRDGNVLGELENPGEAVRIAVPAAVSVDDDDD